MKKGREALKRGGREKEEGKEKDTRMKNENREETGNADKKKVTIKEGERT